MVAVPVGWLPSKLTSVLSTLSSVPLLYVLIHSILGSVLSEVGYLTIQVRLAVSPTSNAASDGSVSIPISGEEGLVSTVNLERGF